MLKMQETGSPRSGVSAPTFSSSKNLSSSPSPSQFFLQPTFLGRPARAKQDWQSVGHTVSLRRSNNRPTSTTLNLVGNNLTNQLLSTLDTCPSSPLLKID